MAKVISRRNLLGVAAGAGAPDVVEVVAPGPVSSARTSPALSGEGWGAVTWWPTIDTPTDARTTAVAPAATHAAT